MEEPLMNNPATAIGTTARNLSRIRYVKCVTDKEVRYELRYSDCGNIRCRQCTAPDGGKRRATHGPYWYLITNRPGTKRRVTIYIGAQLDTHIYRTPEGGFDYGAYLDERDARAEARQASKDAKERKLRGEGTLHVPLCEPERSELPLFDGEIRQDAGREEGLHQPESRPIPTPESRPTDPLNPESTDTTHSPLDLEADPGAIT